MPRPKRVVVEGGVYHVFNRLGRGERVFDQPDKAARFVELLRTVVERDELTVLAWCLMANHYHLAVRISSVSLDRPMRSLQQRATREVNRRRQVSGALWQGRYRAKLVQDEVYLERLLFYIHLNPVTAGLARDPADYRWSGHREVLGKERSPIVDVDEVLRLFGKTRRAARAAYVRRLKGAAAEEWLGEAPGGLPWWRVGRPRSEEDDPETAIRERRRRREEGPKWRPAWEPKPFVVRGAGRLGIELDELRSRSRAPKLVRARELLTLLGVERYGLKLVSLAKELARSPDGLTKAVARAARRRTEDHEFRRALRQLDRFLAKQKQ